MRTKRMIEPRQNTEDYTDALLESENRRIKKLNDTFFNNIELTEDEQRYLRWLCDWDQDTLINIMSAFEKVKNQAKKED